MLKILFFSIALLLCFDANAVVKQSMSKALSYKNIADSGSRSRGRTRGAHRGALTQNKVADPVLLDIREEKVNMKSSDIATVQLNKNDSLEVTLSNDEGYTWKISPSTPSLSLVSDETNGDSRVLNYKILTTLHSYIYFDRIKTETNKVEKTKQLNIHPRD